jgi:mannose-6-phosphate isomerase
MDLTFSSELDKSLIFIELERYLVNQNLKVETKDDNRPWGGFFVIDESESEKFINLYFPHLTKQELTIAGKLSPKILVVGPKKRLSWQYHHRRAEIWKLIGGTAGVVISDTDIEKETKHLELNEIIQLKQGERHRLIGLDGWGIIAEIWRHTDAANPSNEDDIVRVQDDFGR